MDNVLKNAQTISPKNICVQFMFSYQQHEIDNMLKCCEPSATVHFIPLGENGKGMLSELGKKIWQEIVDCFPDLDNTVDAVVFDEDTVRCQVLLSGTQARDFAGIKTKGKHFDSDHIFIFRVNENGLISDLRVLWNHEDFIRQLA